MTDGLRTTMAPEATSRLTANVYETAGGETYVIEIPVPGLTPEEIVIEVDVDSLTVRTEPRQAESESGRTYLQREQMTGPMSRIFEFPTEIDTDNVRATLENGMLKIRVAKTAAGRRRVIRVGQSA
ncbi:MAG: Hsp20/alpha crystallin family protein [Gemmatimonadales bacterium]